MTQEQNTRENTISNTKDSFLLLLAALLLVFSALWFAVCIAVGTVILEPQTFKKAAKNEAYLAGIEKTVNDIIETTATETGLPEKLLKKHASGKTIRELAVDNAADAALVLKGSQVIYGNSFHETELASDIHSYLEKEAEAAEETTPNLSEEADQIAAEFASAVEGAVRVIDMERLVSDHSKERAIERLRFMGRGGALMPLLLLAISLLLLYRQTKKGAFAKWLCGAGICTGVLLLVPIVLILSKGLVSLSLTPEQLSILCETAVKRFIAESAFLALLWFAIAFFALRAALGKPVSAGKLRSWLAARRSPKDEASPEMKRSSSNQDMSEIIKKATADSLSHLLWKRRK